ncbi:hypothetical protein [Flavivirga rizhaonensis]|uniref:Uncharacterized protein n=1 Tax=Flavivirga rizhaonensis TaxID=2559571 RepID=A0A4S1E1F0_9FLAO|nr:hypothetical protein [Flavivirga rizhaonensis]TGV03758.1 hypothetical protein EM932_04925 [Flavivirga rizhaonensis]
MMETFETYYNNQKITFNVTNIETKAQQLNEIAFFLRKKEDLDDFDILDNNTPRSTSFSKEQAKDRVVLEANITFMVDSNQEPNKVKIMKETIIRYSLYDQDTRNTFYSTFVDFEDEYIDHGDEQFTVKKNIEIVLKENLINNHRVFVESLNQ